MAKTAASYISSAPAAHHPQMKMLRNLIKRYFHMAKEAMSGPVKGGAFPIYTVDGTWVAGFSRGKDGVTFHLADPVTLDSYEKYLRGQRSGSTSVTFGEGKEIDLQSLAEVVEECLAASVLFRGLDRPKSWQTGETSKKAPRRKAAKKKMAKKARRKAAAKKTTRKKATRKAPVRKAAGKKKSTRKKR